MEDFKIKKYLYYLFSKYLERDFFSKNEFEHHFNELKFNIKTFEDKELEFSSCEEIKTLLYLKIKNKFIKNKELSEFDKYYIKYIIKKLNNEKEIYNYFEKYGIYNKIAVTYSGHVRNYLKYFNDTKKYFLNLINPDIFIHTWNDYGFQNKNNHLENVEWLKSEDKKINENDIKIKFNPKKIIIENLKSKINSFIIPDEEGIFYFYGQAKDNASKYINGQLYSINKSNYLKNIYEKEKNIVYDLSIRIRFDFILNNYINLEALSNILYFVRINEKLIYIAHPTNTCHGHPGGGGGCKECILNFENNVFKDHNHTNDICDIIAISSSKNMNFYSSLYNISKKIYKENSKNNLINIRKYNLEFTKKNNTYYIMQFGDAIEKYSFCYYPEKLLTKHLEGYTLLNEEVFYGAIKRE